VQINSKGGVDGNEKDLKMRLGRLRWKWNRHEEGMMHPAWPDSKKPINNMLKFLFRRSRSGGSGPKCIG
jgi:hypothetical protein